MGEGGLRRDLNPPGDFTYEELESLVDNPNILRLVDEEPMLKDVAYSTLSMAGSTLKTSFSLE